MMIFIKTQIGNPISKKGRRFPNLPGFLLSTTAPNIIANRADINIVKESPIETRRESKLMVYT